MPTPRTLSEAVTKLENLPVEKILTLLDASATGDLESVKRLGGELTRAELIALQPDGESGALLDALERRALFLLSRRVELVVMRALPTAADVLRGIAESVSCEGDAEREMDSGDVPLVDLALPPHEQEEAQRSIMRGIAKARVSNAKNLSDKQSAALSLFDLAQKLRLFDLAREFREPDRGEAEEAELQAMAEAQGLGDLSGYPKLTQPLRRVR